MREDLVFIIERQDKTYLDWYKDQDSYSTIVFPSNSENKWADVYEIKKKYIKKIKKHRTVTFIDSDVYFNGDLADYLTIFKKYNLQYASPAYTLSDFFSKNDCVIRFVNYIPIKFITFSSSSFDSLDDIFIYNDTGAGVDWVIPKLFDYENVAIIDEFSINSTYKKEDQKFIVNDLVKIYNEFELSSFYNVEFDRIEEDEVRDPFCNVKLQFVKKINKMKFSRPNRRENGCLEADAYLSDRMMMSTGGPWMP
jgi:hypothetical protein